VVVYPAKDRCAVGVNSATGSGLPSISAAADITSKEPAGHTRSPCFQSERSLISARSFQNVTCASAGVGTGFKDDPSSRNSSLR